MHLLLRHAGRHGRRLHGHEQLLHAFGHLRDSVNVQFSGPACIRGGSRLGFCYGYRHGLRKQPGARIWIADSYHDSNTYRLGYLDAHCYCDSDCNLVGYAHRVGNSYGDTYLHCNFDNYADLHSYCER